MVQKSVGLLSPKKAIGEGYIIKGVNLVTSDKGGLSGSTVSLGDPEMTPS